MSSINSSTAPGDSIPTPANLGGYPRLSALFGEHPSLAIFRRFGRLNALNVLYYQAQLEALERKWERYADEDSNSDNYFRKMSSQDWETLIESTTEEGGDDRQWKTMLEIRDVLEKYSKVFDGEENKI